MPAAGRFRPANVTFQEELWLSMSICKLTVSAANRPTTSTRIGSNASRSAGASASPSRPPRRPAVVTRPSAAGMTIAKAKFEFMRADAQGERVKYYEIELENVLIGAVTPSVEEGDILGESVALKFSKVKWRYTQQKISGGSGGNTAGGWDLASNRIAA